MELYSHIDIEIKNGYNFWNLLGMAKKVKSQTWDSTCAIKSRFNYKISLLAICEEQQLFLSSFSPLIFSWNVCKNFRKIIELVISFSPDNPYVICISIDLIIWRGARNAKTRESQMAFLPKIVFLYAAAGHCIL